MTEEQRAESAEGAADAVAKPEERDEVDGRDERIAALEQEVAEHRDQCLRAVAELENVRRRAARDVENAHRYGVERFARELLDVADSMEMGLAAAEKAADAAVAEGFAATLRKLNQLLEKFGITVIDPAGAPFDPQFHEAMAAQPDADAAPDSVLSVVQKGYQIHDRLLRPARVIVAKAPASGEG
jgi:molecular chaperone GrpE